MKILIINYRYFLSGGPERYLFNLKGLLEAMHHDVIPFSIRYERNEYTEFQHYFAAPLSNEKEVYFRDQSWSVRSLLRTLERAFYSKDVYDKLRHLIESTKPDASIVLHYLRKLSPAVLVALRESQVPFVVRLSDFVMICPNALLLRHQKMCERCVGGNILNSVRYRCIQNSYVASTINYFATRFHYHKGYFNLVDSFITPSQFLRNKMISAGWDANKLHYVPTFVMGQGNSPGKKKKSRIVYAGRLDEIKGVHVLLDAITLLQTRSRDLHFETIIVGSGDTHYVNELEQKAKAARLGNVYFLGERTRTETEEILGEALASVVPSICYDNIPNSVLESLARGTPVVASDHGSFPEIVIHGKTGLLFKTGDASDLADKMKSLLENPQLSLEMGHHGKAFVEKYHSPEDHYNRLMVLLDKLRTNRTL